MIKPVKRYEILANVKDGYIYFKTNADTAREAYLALQKAFEKAGINVDNVPFGKVELRENGDDEAIDVYDPNED